MMMVVSIEMLRTVVCFIFRRWVDFEIFNLTVYVIWNTLHSVLCPLLDFDLLGEIHEIIYDPYKIDHRGDTSEWKVYQKTAFDWMKVALKALFLRIPTDLILYLLGNSAEVRHTFATLSRELATSFVVVPVLFYLIHCVFATAVAQLRARGWPCSGEIVVEFRSWPALLIQLRAPHWL